jgi:uncharacterized membrane protein YjjB (DUF3815 family)
MLEMIYLLVANYVFSFTAAFIFHILVEAPVQKAIYQATGIKNYKLEEQIIELK